jgi:hypothetical protein
VIQVSPDPVAPQPLKLRLALGFDADGQLERLD